MPDITITEGNTLEVDYEIENTGDGTGDQDADLFVQSVLEDTDANIVLDPAQTATGTLSWLTENGDAVTDALAEAVTDDTSDSITVTVENAIPDSVLLQYYGTTWDQGDGTWTDDNDVRNMSLSGGIADATLSDGSDALGFDGADDRGTITPVAQMEGGSLESFALEFTISWTSTDTNQFILASSEVVNNQVISIRQNTSGGFDDDVGNILFQLRDQSDNRLEFSPSTNPGLADGNRHDISVVFNDTTQADVTVIIDGVTQTLSFNEVDNLSNFGSWDGAEIYVGDSFQGDLGEFNIGALRWHNSPISDQTISDYP